MRILTKFIGLDETLTAMKALKQAFPQAVRRGIYGFCEEVMTKAKEECPVDTGNLKNSGHVQVQGNDVIMGFGGTAGSGNHGATNNQSVGYAVVVHETHKEKPKFLERPLDEALPQLDRIVAQEIEKVAKGF